VIDLPAGIATWASHLAVLPSDLALALVPWVDRLALAIGPLAGALTQRSGEPDGYSGLSRRGVYERLVATEWAIADLFPEEFLRRATSGEHLFLDLERSEPRGAMRSVVLVSAGPAQLGTPRLAHIAALVVLARRAAAAGARFAWGVLEDPECRLNDGLDERNISRLLEARTAVAASPDTFSTWFAAISTEPELDFWFVGADEDAHDAARLGASRLVVRDVLEPHARALDVDIERRGRSARVRLELPAPDDCARLLRDPFSSGRVTTKLAAAKGPALDVRFAPGGRKLIVRLADDSFESWPIPSSPRESLGKPRYWAPPRNRTVVAVGVGRRSVLAATATRDDTTAIDMYYGNNHSIRVMVPQPVAQTLAERLASRDPVRYGTCAIVQLRARGPSDLVLDILGHLLVVPGFSLWPRAGTVMTALPFNGERPVLATAFFHKNLVWAEAQADGPVDVLEATSSGNRRVATVEACSAPDVHFGFADPSQEWGVVSTAVLGDQRCIAAPKLDATKVHTVVPAVGVCMRNGVPGLLLRPNPHRLAWEFEGRRELLPTTSAPIAGVAVCTAYPHIAWVTEDGDAVIYSMQHKAVLLRRTQAAAP
jgi:hypothetical protein